MFIDDIMEEAHKARKQVEKAMLLDIDYQPQDQPIPVTLKCGFYGDKLVHFEPCECDWEYEKHVNK